MISVDTISRRDFDMPWKQYRIYLIRQAPTDILYLVLSFQSHIYCVHRTQLQARHLFVFVVFLIPW